MKGRFRKRLLGVSFPRSGHNLVERILRSCFGDEYHYCDNNEHCQSIPCSEPSNIFQKNHDFHLSTPKIPGERYLVQYRHPYESIASWYELDIRQGHITPEMDTVDQWTEMLKHQTFYWQSFTSKWIIVHPPTLNITLQFNELVKDLEKWMNRIVHFIDPDFAIDRKVLMKAIEKEREWKNRPITSFKYYDECQLYSYEKVMEPNLRRLGLDTLLIEKN